MKLCERGHEQIVHESDFCPLCRTLDDREEKYQEIEILKERIRELNEVLRKSKGE